MSVITIGLDLAKTLFQVHGVGENRHTVLRRSFLAQISSRFS
ncbi:MAG TPA: hypothetical protein VJM09_14945 [Sphingobium sp.]|nr:hypothetical protein [Sphingobium sp.]